MEHFLQENIRQLQDGKIGVIPTDTLYGLVGSVMRPDVVEKIYTLRVRDVEKPCIILIADITDLQLFDILLSAQEQGYLSKWWPGAVSIILPIKHDVFMYLHRSKDSLAFRFPDDEALCELLRQTGPLIAPSANIQGMPPATTLDEARAYFGERVDFYVDGGVLQSEPSTLVRFENGQPLIIRQGAVKIC